MVPIEDLDLLVLDCSCKESLEDDEDSSLDSLFGGGAGTAAVAAVFWTIGDVLGVPCTIKTAFGELEGVIFAVGGGVCGGCAGPIEVSDCFWIFLAARSYFRADFFFGFYSSLFLSSYFVFRFLFIF